jgi:antitoxin CptB
MSQETREERLKRLKFRAWHRGMKEMDIICGRFFDANTKNLSNEDLDLFENLLQENDQDIFSWIMGRSDIPQQHDHHIFESIKNFDFNTTK